jgi:hypothetical protein
MTREQENKPHFNRGAKRKRMMCIKGLESFTLN